MVITMNFINDNVNGGEGYQTSDDADVNYDDDDDANDDENDDENDNENGDDNGDNFDA